MYLDSADLRREYVLNEQGKIFVGTHRRPKGRPWNYGQFSDLILPVTQLLLEVSNLSYVQRGDAAQIVRAISSVVNSDEDGGLVEGKWIGAYEDEVSPWFWTNTSKIFQQYLENGFRPVKYGQCWVFAAITTTSTYPPK